MAEPKGAVLLGEARALGPWNVSPSNGGGYFGYNAGEAYPVPFYIPSSISFTIDYAYVGNADTTSDATLTVRIGLYEIIADMSLTLLNDYGTIGKDTTAITTLRQVGSTYVTTLGPNKMYAWVSLMEVGRAGASTCFRSVPGRTNWGNPWGAVGDNSTNDFDLIGNGAGSNGTIPGWSGLSAGGLPSTLAIPTYVSANVRPPAVWVGITAATG